MRLRLRHCAQGAAAGLVLLAAALGFTTPASATPPSPIAAGYEVQSSSAPLTLAGHVTVPAVTCSAVITGKLLTSFVVSTKVGGVALFLGVTCSGATAHYSANVVIDSIVTTMAAPSAGDVMSFSGSSAGMATATDLTTGATKSATGVGGVPSGVAVNAGSDGTSEFPPFTRIRFSHLAVNSKTISSFGPIRYNEGVRIGKHKFVIEIRASKLAPAGNAFSDVYLTNTP